MKRLFNTLLARPGLRVWAVLFLLIPILALRANDFIAGFAVGPPYPDDGLWYSSIYGESTGDVVCTAIAALWLLFFIVILAKKLPWEAVLSSKALRLIGVLLPAAVVVISLILPRNYDVVHLDRDGFTFSSHRAFREPAKYTLDDAVSIRVRDTDDMRLVMRDGTEVRAGFGALRLSKGLSGSGYGVSRIQHYLCVTMDARGVPITVENRAAIERKVEKYSMRSDAYHWQVYLPYILENASGPG